MIHSGGFSEKLTLVSTGVYRTVHSRAELRKTASGTWVLDHGNGPRDTFNATGRLIVREVRPGYALTLAYNAAGRLISVSNPFTSMILLGYDNAGRLQSLTSPAGHVTQYGYDAAGNLSLVTLPNGTTRIYHYEDARWPNAMTGITNENGTRYATYAYDDIGRGILTEHAGGSNRHTLNYFADRTEVGTPLGAARVYRFQMISGARKVTSIEETCQSCAGGKSTVTFTYDTQGNTTSRTNALGTKTTYAYNLARNLETSRTEAYGTPLARTVTTQWHATLRLPTQISEPGKVTSFTYDAQGNLLSRAVTASGETRTWTYTYNNYGQMLTEDGPRTDVNDITTYTYNAQGNLAGITNALGHSTLITQYNSDGLPVTIQDANGIITSLVHDIRGRLLSSTRAGATHSLTYDGAGNVITSTDPAGVTQTYTYDGDNRLTRITDSQGNHIDYTLNLLGSRVSEQIVDSNNQLAYARSSLYDTLGRLQQVLNAAGQTRQTVTTDALGNILTRTDGLQHTTTSSYDALGRLAASIDPANGTTSYGYDAQDNLTSVTDANNHITSYNHNAFGERISETSPNTGTVTYTRDSAGNMASKTDARGVTTTFSYDAINRTTAINYPTSALNIAYSYDQGSNGIGRLTAMTDASGLTSYTYNALGHLITSNHAGRQTSYQYDTAGRLTQITYPSGHTAAYARNSVGKVTQVNVTLDTQTYPVASNISYQPYGDVTALTFGNGLAWTRTIDTDGRLTQNTLPNVQSAGIGYDDADRITSLSDQLSPALSQAFQYDAADRLTQATGAYGVQQYAYDATGNRTSLTTNGNSTAYHYASNSQRLLSLTGANTDTLDYDANGNTVFQIGYPLTFDDRNRLTALNGVSFQYNGKGERVEKSVAGTSTRYVYNPQGQLLAETDSNNITLREYVWLGHWPIAVITPQPAQPSRIDYIHPDHLGTPRLVTNASQTIIWRWDSSPFGATDAQQDPDGDNQAFVLNLRFPGQYFDDETGLHYNYFRDYDPTLGRYIESDPIGLRGGINTYAYVSGSPVMMTDPEGKSIAAAATCELGVLIIKGLSEVLQAYNVANETFEAAKLAAEQVQELEQKIDQCPSNNPKRKRKLMELRDKAKKDALDLTKDYAKANDGGMGLGASKDALAAKVAYGACAALLLIPGP
ncbi:MAG: RHS repeat-associated core domain-containing protein [Moraxellaceae bacterium]|nr:RHS repeat-associated core domain-containing protein [Moraxellaceae bacterium]